MGRRGVQAAGDAAKAALSEIVDGTLFSIVSGNGTAQIVYPYSHQGALVPMSSHTRGEATRAIEGLRASGGTAMGTWLTLARQIFETVPHVTKRHAILLTDGVNEGETPASLAAAVQSCVGVFQCDCRGVGDQWRVEEVRGIASALLGTVDLIPAPEEMAAEFEAMMRASMVARRRERRAARLGAAGRRAALRQAGLADARRPLLAAHDGQPAHRCLPDRRVVRREP